MREVVGLVRPGGVVVIATEDAWTSQTAWERQCGIDRVLRHGDYPMAVARRT